MRILVAAGGTAGHVVPALAVADALRADGHDVRWVGGERAEARLVPQAGYELDTIRVEGISRTNPLKAARALGRAGGAFLAARGIVQAFGPDVVLGGGGYVAGPVGLAAVRARVPLVLTEADSHLGLTNRLLARWARRVCLAFPIAGRTGTRYLVTGRPVPPPARSRTAARERFGLAEGVPCVLVFGGSLGARSINEASVAGLRGGAFSVLHAAGTRDYAALRARLDASVGTTGADGAAGAGGATGADGAAGAGGATGADRAAVAGGATGADGSAGTGGTTGADGAAGAGGTTRADGAAGAGGANEAQSAAEGSEPGERGYDLREYIDGFGEALLACDLCVARSGGSIFEVAAAGKPAILVPYPHAAADHQTGNAQWMVDGGAATLIDDAELTPSRLRAEVDALLGDPDRLRAMAQASLALARPDAAAAIAAEVLRAG